MTLAWYRKWRPKVFADVIGQDHVVTVLRQALKHQVVSHAYLFCGPRGVGKTTMARLLAKAVNCLALDLTSNTIDPCGQCLNCTAFDEERMIDCLEIDAASNRGIDDIRALRDTVGLAPTMGNKKIYIIDEVHMLTKEAFNALLKTLEEPPAHVILILATTEIGKVPATIISRCQHFDFRPLSEGLLTEQLVKIAKAEKINLTKDGAKLLAEAATGSGRDALSLLQQISLNDGSLDADTIARILGFVPSSSVVELLLILRNDQAKALNRLQKMLEQGLDSEQLIRSVLRAIAIVIEGEKQVWADGLSVEVLLRVAEEWAWALRQVKGHPESYLVLATALLATSKLYISHQDTALATILEKPDSNVVIPKAEEAEAPVIEQKQDTKTIDVSITLKAEEWGPTTKNAERLWQHLIKSAEPQNHTLAALLKGAELLGLEEGEHPTMVIGVHFPFHKARIQEIKNRRILEDILQQETGQEIRVRCDLVAAARTPHTETDLSDKKVALSDDELVQAAEQLFSGGAS